jgi:hypothetical protein
MLPVHGGIFIYSAEFINTAAVKTCKMLLKIRHISAYMKQHGRPINCSYEYSELTRMKFVNESVMQCIKNGCEQN